VPQVKSVSLKVEPTDGAVVAYVTLDVDPYPFGDVDVEYIIDCDGEVVARKTIPRVRRGQVTDSVTLTLGPGEHLLKAYARTRDRYYPDDFLRSLRPKEYWIYVYYPVVYVWCRGSTERPRYITAPDKFLESIADWLWYYDWEGLRVLRWVDVPLEYPPGYRALKEVEWEGRFVYMINADETTNGVAKRICDWMRSYWGLENSECKACVDDVRAEQWA